MQQNNQESFDYQTDKIDLKKLYNSLLARKLLIFSLTGFVTLLAIIYALKITPTYKATSSFTSPNQFSILNLNRLDLADESKESVFSKYLTLLSSKEFQKKVFIGNVSNKKVSQELTKSMFYPKLLNGYLF